MADEDAAITAAAELDADNPPLTDDELRHLRPATAEEIAATERARGQRGPGKKPKKVQVTLRLDPVVVDEFRATGRGWQKRLNDELVRIVRKHRA